MKLYYSDASPYARKVRVVAAELGVTLELLPADTLAHESDYGLINPVHRIPALVLEDGQVLINSPVISEYLDVHFGPKLLPPAGAARWEVLQLQSLGDGLMDAAVPRRHENARPAEQQSPDRLWRYKRSMDQTMDYLEQNIARLAGINLGTIAIAAGLGYTSFRHAGDDWEAHRPKLAAWYAEFATRASMLATPHPG